MPLVAVIALVALALGGAMFAWIFVKAARGMERDKDAMQIGRYNFWDPPPPSPPFPKPERPKDR